MQPHILPLAAYIETLRPDWTEVPDFDPLDGGIEAEALFLLEKPGPMTSPLGRRPGSGFISRDNDDLTAEATFTFMRQAGFSRRRTVIWNVIPGWNGTTNLTGAERRRGLACLGALLERLPNVRAVMLVGRSAGLAEPLLQTIGLQVFHSAHPSPQVRAGYRARWDAIPGQWQAMREWLDAG